MILKFRIGLAAVVFSLTCSATFAQQAHPAPSVSDPEPSLEETLSWLKNKLETLLSSSGSRGDVMTSKTFEAREFKSCDISWQYTFSATTAVRNIGIEPEGERIRGNVGSIDPTKTKVASGKALVLLLLYTKEDEGFIEEKFQTKFGRETVTTRRTGLVMINFPRVDEATVDRIAKAFNHAAKLCAKSTKEPF